MKNLTSIVNFTVAVVATANAPRVIFGETTHLSTHPLKNIKDFSRTTG
jgi:hypothetical protein